MRLMTCNLIEQTEKNKLIIIIEVDNMWYTI
jgi:hypothetical protein